LTIAIANIFRYKWQSASTLPFFHGELWQKLSRECCEVDEMTLLNGLDTQTIDTIESLAVTKSYPKNSIIINQGDESDAFYLMLSGMAMAMILHEDGRQIVLGTLQPGDYFGEISCLDGELRSATVMAREPCKCLMISKKDFHDLCREHPGLVWSLIQDQVRKLRKATRKIEELAFMDVYSRVARYLIENKEQHIIEQKLTHQDIAFVVGSSREMVSRVMKELALNGYIRQAKGSVRILKDLPFHNGDF
jgi:CRP/FNR family cyclic AMP-dependent transcriptional regulator